MIYILPSETISQLFIDIFSVSVAGSYDDIEAGLTGLDGV